ncbi:rhomboid family intramembrane serine protease [bacterium]|nr:rhomboid family intramembrane serine protease [bacterium]
MIPIRDENPTRTTAYFTVGLIVINVLVFLYELALPGPAHLEAFVADFALVPVALTQGPTVADYGTIFTSMFLHGGLAHLLGNMLYLWIFGNNIEDACGHRRFLVFYFACGVAAAAAQVAVNPGSTVPMVGASGAISGVLGAYVLLYPRARVLVLIPILIFLKFVRVPAVLLLVVWFLMQLLSGWATLDQGQGGGVAFWAHIGGFVAGLALIPLFKRRGVRLFR